MKSFFIEKNLFVRALALYIFLWLIHINISILALLILIGLVVVVLFRKNKVEEANPTTALRAPIEGVMESYNFDNGKHELNFKMNPFGPWGVLSPVVGEVIQFKEEKNCEIEIEREDKSIVKIRISPNYFHSQIWVRPGDKIMSGAFLGFCLGTAEVKMTYEGPALNEKLVFPKQVITGEKIL